MSLKPYDSVDIRVGMERVTFEVDAAPYRGGPDFSAEALDELAEARQTDPESYGLLLREKAFREGASEGFARLMEFGRRSRIRLRIDVKAPALHRLWWECLFDEGTPLPLGMATYTPLSRYLEVFKPVPPAVPKPPLRLLVVLCNPEDLGRDRWRELPPLKPEVEWDTMDKALAEFDEKELIVEHHEGAASLGAIRERLQDGRFHILHIIGHGFMAEDGTGHLLLEGRDGKNDRKASLMAEDQLAALVNGLEELRLVVLAACHSAERSDASAFQGLAPAMVRAGVPAVVAMQDLVQQATAQTFALRFYGSLAKSTSTQGFVDAAVNMARDQINIECRQHNRSNWQWPMPVLFLRGHGRLLERVSTPRRSKGIPGGNRRARAVDGERSSFAEPTKAAPSKVIKLPRNQLPPREPQPADITVISQLLREIGSDLALIDLVCAYAAVEVHEQMALPQKLLALKAHAVEHGMVEELLAYVQSLGSALRASPITRPGPGGVVAS
jgi:hypothetical protein